MAQTVMACVMAVALGGGMEMGLVRHAPADPVYNSGAHAPVLAPSLARGLGRPRRWMGRWPGLEKGLRPIM